MVGRLKRLITGETATRDSGGWLLGLLDIEQRLNRVSDYHHLKGLEESLAKRNIIDKGGRGSLKNKRQREKRPQGMPQDRFYQQRRYQAWGVLNPLTQKMKEGVIGNATEFQLKRGLTQT